MQDQLGDGYISDDEFQPRAVMDPDYVPLDLIPPSQSFGNLNSFFKNSFLPTQMISTFLGLGNWLNKAEKQKL